MCMMMFNIVCVCNCYLYNYMFMRIFYIVLRILITCKWGLRYLEKYEKKKLQCEKKNKLFKKDGGLA